MRRLRNVIQPYPWGSHTAIAALQGRAPGARPEAELWLGAHPVAPSVVEGEGALDALVAARPAELLGERVVDRFGPRLPFLMKVLAAARPLSIQAHPDVHQARAGFEREEAAHVPLGAAHRSYRDASAKPELLCALEPTAALCGFRPLEETRALAAALGLPAELFARGLKETFEHLFALPVERVGALVAQVRDAAARHGGPFAREARWLERLAELYPGDPGVLAALMLNLVELAPGEAIYLGPGVLHAYLEGVGIEVMASSDNVLRGGLTSKHVDVPELLRVLRFESGEPTLLRVEGPVAVYPTPAEEFELTRVELDRRALTLPRAGPDLILVTRGEVRLDGEPLARGDAVFVGAAEVNVLELEGTGQLFRCTVGRL